MSVNETPVTVICVFVSVFFRYACGIAIDNEIIGEPHLDCMSSGIRLRITTRNPFIGRIFVKGEAHNPECSTSPTGSRFQPPPQFPTDNSDPLFALNFDRCGMYRLRMLNPRGMMYSSTIIVSFHPIFVTKVDRAYKVECFYGEIDRTLSAQLNVSMIPTTSLTDQSAMPQCQYTVRSQTLEGPIIRFAKVGEPVVHRWECNSDMYGFVVKDCYVENGKGERFAVINQHGCALDPVLITQVNYDRTSPLAFAESHVFKFADVSNLNFQCQIQICLKMEGGCDNITPPRCPLFDAPPVAVRQRRDTLLETTPSTTKSDELDVRNRLTVFDIDDPVDRQLKTTLDNVSRGPRTVTLGALNDRNCIMGGVGVAIVVVCLGVIVMLSVISVLYFLRNRDDSSNSKGDSFASGN